MVSQERASAVEGPPVRLLHRGCWTASTTGRSEQSFPSGRRNRRDCRMTIPNFSLGQPRSEASRVQSDGIYSGQEQGRRPSGTSTRTDNNLYIDRRDHSSCSTDSQTGNAHSLVTQNTTIQVTFLLRLSSKFRSLSFSHHSGKYE